MLKNSINGTQNNDEIANVVCSLFPSLSGDIPIAYIAKKWFFYGLPFFVDESALVPRFETELLVKAVLTEAAKDTVQGGGREISVLDLCTGSGCIAAALAKNLGKHVKVYASDISEKALSVARKNAKTHGADIKFFQSDMLDNLAEKFDIIVCNPPYIKTSDIGKYDKSTLNEPHLALDGGEDGLCFYRRLAREAPEYLTAGGYLFLEIGHDQGEDVKKLLSAADFNDINIVKDHAGHDRVIKCKKN